MIVIVTEIAKALNLVVFTSSNIKVKQNSRNETVTIRTKILHSKPKWEITTILNSQIANSTSGKPSEQLFPRKDGDSAIITYKIEADIKSK